MLMRKTAIYFIAMLVLTCFASAADNLKLNPKLDYTSDSADGPLITGDHMQAGIVKGKPTYVIIFAEQCFNSKRQARRTVSLYEKYQGRVQFVVADLDKGLSSAQNELKKKYYRGYIPHVVVLDSSGNPVYNASGEVEESVISGLLDKALN